MGQAFDLINLDMRTFVKYDKYLAVWRAYAFARFATEDWWIGNRLIFLGSGAQRFPPGVLMGEEEEECLESPCPLAWSTSDPFTRSGGTGNWELSNQQNLVLVNFSNREYIRGDLFTGKPANTCYWKDFSHPGLSQALLARITWTHEYSMPRFWIFGSWAGSQVGVKDLKEYQDRSEYKDITEIVFHEVYTIWQDDRNPPCECDLCKKFLQMERDGFDPYAEPEMKQANPPLSDDSRQEIIHNVEHPLSAPEPVIAYSHHQPRYFPFDIQYQIFAELSPSSLAACALVCRGYTYEATCALYRDVSVRSASHLDTLSETLTKDPYKKHYIQRLSLQLRIVAADRDILHSILIQLPNLRHLTLHACWISYGDPPVDSYPFQLRTLYWGLIPDLSMNLFLRSQPSLQELEFPEGYDPISNWFRFWPNLLPNLRKATATWGMIECLKNLNVVRSRRCNLNVQRAAYDPFETERYFKWECGGQ